MSMETDRRAADGRFQSYVADPESMTNTCAGCGHVSHHESFWLDYCCRYCKTFNAALWKAEHLDPVAAKGMSLADIAAEYIEAGMTPPVGIVA